MDRRAAILAAVILFVAVAVIGYIYWIRTPQYSLRQISHAIETHDLALFEKHVDVKSVASRLIDDLLATSASDGSNLGVGSTLALGIIQLMKPRLVEAVREQASRLVETGSFGGGASDATPADSGTASLAGLSHGLGTDRDAFRGVGYVRREGKIATVGLDFRNALLETTLALDLKMRNEGSYWRLVEFSNINALLRATREVRESRLAARNAPIRKAIDRVLTVSHAAKESRSDEWGISKSVDLGLTIRNRSTRTVTGFTATVLVRRASGDLVRELRVQGGSPILPSSESETYWTFDVNLFDSSDQALYDLPSGDTRFDVTFDRIAFDDGSELAVYESLEQAVSQESVGGGGG